MWRFLYASCASIARNSAVPGRLDLGGVVLQGRARPRDLVPSAGESTRSATAGSKRRPPVNCSA